MYLAMQNPNMTPGAADRVSRAGHPAADVDDRRRRRRADPRRRELCDAGLDRPVAARGARRDGRGRAGGDQRLELPVGARQDRERVRRLRSPMQLDAADAGGLRRAAAAVGGRRGGAAARRGARSSSPREKPTRGRHLQRPARHLHRRLPDAGRQPARHRGGGGQGAAGDPTPRCRRA